MAVPIASSPISLSHQMNLIITLLLILIMTIPYYSASLEFNFPKMEKNSMLITEGNATYMGSEILLTPNETDHIGRVSYVQPVQLRNDSSGTVVLADFATEFSFIIHADQKPAPGDGIAFFLASPPYEFPRITDGRGIGLLSSEVLESNKHPLVAVEFDTFRNDKFDPQDVGEHVGINVLTMKSVVTTAWSCDITSGNVYNATVSYDSRSKNLSVVFTGYQDNVPIKQRLSYEIDLADTFPTGWATIGFSAANGLFTSRHILRSWSFNSTFGTDSGTTESASPRKGSSKSAKTGLVVGLAAGGLVLASVVGLIGLVLRRKRIRKEERGDLVFDLSMDNDFERNTGAKRFSYNELRAATNNFAEDEKLGRGGFGGVYRGFLKNLNSYVAVKKVSSVSDQGIKEYASEVKIISQLRHKNLVQLIGWCHRGKDLLLIYEFMPNGSLDSHLFKGKTLLPWPARYNIARGLASALLYLHEEWEQCVLHRDIKASNILLDSQFNAKLGDFGLARLVDHEKGSQTTALAGTLGYMAPECLVSGRASRGSDVYSFGVVVLEIACGRKSIEPNAEEARVGLIEWVWALHGTRCILEAADPKLGGEFDEQQMERLMIVGLWCANPDPGSRPSIKQAIHVLDFQAPLPLLPRDMPEVTHLPRLARRAEQSSQFSGTGKSNFEIGSETQSSSNYTSSSQFTQSSGVNSPSTALLSTRQCISP